jgi:hypothetical protein
MILNLKLKSEYWIQGFLILLLFYILYQSLKFIKMASNFKLKITIFIEKNVPNLRASIITVLSTYDKLISKVTDVAMTAICLL